MLLRGELCTSGSAAVLSRSARVSSQLGSALERGNRAGCPILWELGTCQGCCLKGQQLNISRGNSKNSLGGDPGALRAPASLGLPQKRLRCFPAGSCKGPGEGKSVRLKRCRIPEGFGIPGASPAHQHTASPGSALLLGPRCEWGGVGSVPWTGQGGPQGCCLEGGLFFSWSTGIWVKPQGFG